MSPIPEWLLSLLAAATLFVVMFGVGLNVSLAEARVAWQRPGLLVRGLLATLVAVPLLALAITRALALPRPAEIGVVLMSISPGAPMALRNVLAAGGHRGFAPSLQIAVAVLAVASLPLSIAVLDRYYAGAASIAPLAVAKQVCVAQLLPLGLGIAARYARVRFATDREAGIARAGNVLLALLVVAAGIDVWGAAVGSGLRVATAIVLTTAGAVALGHLLGGDTPGIATAIATTAGTRNAGMALLVATLNAASPEIKRTVLAYIAFSLPVVLVYLTWRRRLGVASAAA